MRDLNTPEQESLNSEKRAVSGQPELQYFLEEEKVNHETHTFHLRGWVTGKSQVAIQFYDSGRKPIPADIRRYERKDVEEIVGRSEENPVPGFYAELTNLTGRYLWAEFRDQSGNVLRYRCNISKFDIACSGYWKLLKKTVRYVQHHGLKGIAEKMRGELRQRRLRPMDYSEWKKKSDPTEEELKQQRQQKFAYEPLISIVIPLYKTRENWLRELIESIQAQTYSNWQLCLSDGSGVPSPLEKLLQEYEKADPRITVVRSETPLHISENTNAAIEAARGEFIAFSDHDDLLSPNALYECVAALNAHPETEMLYSDEDKVSANGSEYMEPQYKPDYNPDLLRTVNYICHLFVAKRSLLDQVGFLRPEYDGAQDYDLILRCTEKSQKIVHIPKILYHWRATEVSTSANPESKRYAFEAGERALNEHFRRIKVPAKVYPGEFPGLYRTRYQWEETPLVSIIIPNKDHTEDLERCISSIEEKSTYKNYEYIIIENNSTESETFTYYEQLKRKNPKVQVVYFSGPFNYSEINNFGASCAKGDYYLLLNNDTEIISENWIEEMLGYCMRGDVGIVGARLYYEDDTVQHAGVVIGFGEVAGHCFVMQPRNATGYCHRIISAQDYSAVTAACMMVKRTVFEQVGGLSTDLAVAFNDVDFCLKVRNAGYLVVYNPYVELYHYESKSRGLEDTPEKQARFAKEIKTIHSHWPEVFASPDPYYNPNLTRISQDFCLKRSWEE